MSDTELRRRIRTKLLIGELPSRPPFTTRGAPATKMRCAACDLKIETVWEMKVESADGRARSYHLPCYDVVVAEREVLRRAEATDPGFRRVAR